MDVFSKRRCPCSHDGEGDDAPEDGSVGTDVDVHRESPFCRSVRRICHPPDRGAVRFPGGWEAKKKPLIYLYRRTTHVVQGILCSNAFYFLHASFFLPITKKVPATKSFYLFTSCRRLSSADNSRPTNRYVCVFRRWENPVQLGFLRGLLDNNAANNVAAANAFVPELGGGENEVKLLLLLLNFRVDVVWLFWSSSSGLK